MTKKNPKEIHHLHFIGIRGVAMSGLAIMTRSLGYVVTGSDVDRIFSKEIEEAFAKNKIKVFNGFSAENLKPKPDMVVVSAAYGLTNPEFKAAKARRIPIKTHSEMLGQVMANYEGIGVAGVHGKTTVTSMLAFILQEGGYSPSYAIGVFDVPGLLGNGHIGEGKYFVAEADEYKKSEDSKEPRFLDLPLKHLIITSIELDHPDVYSSSEDVYQAFYRLSVKIKRDGTLIACIDSPLVRRLANRRVDLKCLTYGVAPSADFRLVDFHQAERSSFFVETDGSRLGPFELGLPGLYNALNATAAITMAVRLGVPEGVIAKALKIFKGPKRRFEYLGIINQAEVYDDYAHHPTAIKVLLEAARARFPTKKIVIVFQPHTYSRTGKLLRDFAQSLAKADRVVLLNIFASAREKSGYVTIKDLIDELKDVKGEVEYRSSLTEAANYLKSSLTKSDVLLLVGAGDVYKIFDLASA